MEAHRAILQRATIFKVTDDPWGRKTPAPDVERGWGLQRDPLSASLEAVAHAIGLHDDDATEVELLRRVVAQQAVLLAKLTEKVEALQTPAHRSAPSIDAIEQWRRAHRVELQRFQGQRVAIHPEQGVVAHDVDLKKVIARVRELGLIGQVVVESVHPPRALPR